MSEAVYHAVMPAKRLVTVEEFMALGEGRRELIRGEVVEMTPSGARHCRIAATLGHRLSAFVEQGGLGCIYAAECGFQIERDPPIVRAPDAAFVAAGRLEGSSEIGYLPFAPDLAVEVVSPSDSFGEVEEKARMWLAHGGRLVWVVEPDIRRVFVYRPSGPRTDLGPGDSLSGEDVLPGFTLPVADCF